MNRATVVLVIVDAKECRYSRYEGRARTDRLQCAAPLSAYWVEELRNDPQQLNIIEAEAPEAA